jgi:hypothetical protein
MAGFLGIGGKQAQDSDTAQKGLGSLGNIFNFGLNRANALSSTGTGTTATGVNTAAGALPTIRTGSAAIGNSLNYFNNLVNGNRTATTQAAAPQTNAALQQGDAARRQQGSLGTARGGGVASTNQTQHDAMMTQINNAIFGVRPAAAAQETQAGSELSATGGTAAQVGLGIGGIGTTETGQGLTAGGLAGSAADAQTKDALGAQKQSYDIARQQTGDVLKMIFG